MGATTERLFNLGVQNTRLEMAQKMLKDNLPWEKIAQYTSLSMEEVKSLAEGKA